ncbi:hypothetical protein GCM10010492_50540 [Saccharothrix mutabilis subsp. mutabilis]|uniref:Uncharacterized protein n=1 Tax=Saccharothrix mutabilis subsp. mutabilis TaxID=66855 RepID=A0ABN0UBN5_9PSEU
MRRTRSINTPANSENSNQGDCPTTCTNDTSRGSVVIDTAASGSTVSINPSATEPDTATACNRAHPRDMPVTLPSGVENEDV